MTDESLKRRVGLKEKIRAWLNDRENRSVLVPYIIFGIFALICYLFFCYRDILLTAQHSYAYLDGRIFDYYSASHEMDGTFGSNYMPSTFILFAIWNLPLKLLGGAPAFYGDWGVVFVLWNKLLPTLAYFASACLMYKLAVGRLNFGRGKSMLTALALLTSPCAFFSQFIFCQYDSFVMFFMLLGMYYFFEEKPTRRSWVLFGLCFGIAFTFKYFAAVIFAILLLLKEKNIPKILLKLIPFAAPIALECGFYLIFDRASFIQSVFKFSALGYADGFVLKLNVGTLNFVYLALIVLCAFAYFTKPKDSFELLGWGCFYSCGACFVMFGLMSWHPQWLLFAAPFWTLSIMINRHWNVFMFVDCIAAVIFNMLVVNAYTHSVDDNLFRYGILSGELQFSEANTFSMKDVLVYGDTSILFTLLAAVFLVSFIFKHPRFNQGLPDEPLKHAERWITARFLCAVLTFVIPAFICLPSFTSQSDYLWGNFADSDMNASLILTTDKNDFCQYFSVNGSQIEAISVMTEYVVDEEAEAEKEKQEEADRHSFDRLLAKETQEEPAELFPTVTVELLDAESGEVLGVGTLALNEVSDGGYTRFELEKAVDVESGRLYMVRLYTSEENVLSVKCGSVVLPTYRYYNTATQDYSDSRLTYCGQEAASGVGAVMNVYGEH